MPAVASAHPPEAKTVCPDGYTLSTDETECSKPVVKDHGEAQCDPGYSLVSKARGASVCEKEVGKPTCEQGTGDDYVSTTYHGPPNKCADGEHDGSKCIDQKTPVCAKGALQGTKCIERTTDTTPPMNTLNHHVAHACPASHQQTPPLPLIYFVYTSVTPELMTHEQLNEYVKNGGLASSNPGKWEKLDDTHNCYKAVEDKGKTINLLKVIINGVEYAVNTGKMVVNNVEYTVTEAGKVVIGGVQRRGLLRVDHRLSDPDRQHRQFGYAYGERRHFGNQIPEMDQPGLLDHL